LESAGDPFADNQHLWIAHTGVVREPDTAPSRVAQSVCRR